MPNDPDELDNLDAIPLYLQPTKAPNYPRISLRRDGWAVAKPGLMGD